MEEFKDIVEVIDTTRPKKFAWQWSRATFDKYQALHGGIYKVVNEKKLIVKPLLKVQEIIEGKPEARQKKDNKKK